ncbi:MAG: PEP/pyruvate-binding domain-containing protein [Candidatus Omnitrophota bacterium]|nr:PEP/pyruvate-binding domain-containing protein [Candidatus Omnitrophota bacterium]
MISTGIIGLDDILNGLRAGDNVVWQIDEIDEYKDFVTPFVEQALKENKNVVYMRFAEHESLLAPTKGIKVYELDAKGGFESFSTEVNNIITEEGIGAYYVFDCLSDLLPAWATDLMISNFFMITCPYLYELDTVTYFSILRNNHSFKTVARIRETTQLLLDVYRCYGNYYVHPLKVWNRYSPTMFLPHKKEGKEFVPLTDSGNAAEVLSYIKQKGTENLKRYIDYWDRLFLKAEELDAASPGKGRKLEMIERLCGIMIGRDEKILSLASKNFSLAELIDIKARLIGTGYIGGKAVGMLLARKILEKKEKLGWKEVAEPHDSFYIGSDVFYSYIVQNNWWKLRMEQKTKEGYFDAARSLKERMLHGKFPDEVMEQFQQMIEYFGTSPIIVRSSSLLEDGFGNAFAGKYESVFCPNQGTPEQRYMQFLDAVRKIYASTMSEDALAYRHKRGLDSLDEQMALLVQRVSGAYHDDLFFPDIGGVGVSHNTYVWNKKMRSEAGVLRIVFGLGTRAVNRVEGDYPRIVALDEPLLKPYADMSDIKRFSQHNVDVINVKNNMFETVPFDGLLNSDRELDLDLIAVKDEASIRWMKDKGLEPRDVRIITFDKLFSDDAFSGILGKVLKTLEDNYQYPVEIEFTVNFKKEGKFKMNLLQCRPLPTHGIGKKVEIPSGISDKDTVFSSEGYFLGGNVSQPIRRIMYVDPLKYIALTLSEKYDIARTIGKLNMEIGDRDTIPTLLLGPGRWGTSTPSLGVPVSFAEISNITAMGEIAFPEGNLMPELSFGTHFFLDLVETDIFYVALFPANDNVVFNDGYFSSFNNRLPEMVPDAEKYKDVIGVYDVDLKLMSDVMSQQVVCFSK